MVPCTSNKGYPRPEDNAKPRRGLPSNLAVILGSRITTPREVPTEFATRRRALRRISGMVSHVENGARMRELCADEVLCSQTSSEGIFCVRGPIGVFRTILECTFSCLQRGAIHMLTQCSSISSVPSMCRADF